MTVTYGQVSSKLAAYAAGHMLGKSASSLILDEFSTVRVRNRYWSDPLSVPCSVCEAAAGEPCRPVRRHFNWFGGKHGERIQDAKLVSEAVEALTPPPTIKWR